MNIRIEILRGLCIGGGKDAFPGDICEVDERRADQLIRAGKARLAPVAASAEAKAQAATAPMPDADALKPESRDPKGWRKR